MPSYTPWAVYLPVYTSLPTHPGYTIYTAVLPVPTPALVHHREAYPWAQQGDLAWV